MLDSPNGKFRPGGPFSSTAAAQKVAIATSVAALLMFGALIYNGNGREAAASSNAASCPAMMADQSPAVTVQATEATDEDQASDDATADDADAKARKAATDAVKEALPGSKVEGVFTLSFGRGTLYLCGADTIGGDGKRRTVDCLARLYTRKNGGQYWRAELLNEAETAALLRRVERDDE